MLDETSEKQDEIKTIQRYEIRKHIGQGAMADVYEAYDPRIDRLLAIKILREERSIDKDYIERFMREAKAVGNLSHPHIVTIYDVGEAEKRPYLVMELLDGTPLNELIKSGKKYSLNEILSIGAQLGSALHYAHSRGVVHRDIKPSNIVCDETTNTVKITDFGIAHFVDSDLTQQTQVGDLIGTPQYMSPEQVGGAAIDGRSDLFSVGVILYQLLTGQRPFSGESVAALMYQIIHTEPTPLLQVDSTIPVTVRNIVEKLLRKNPNDRFQTGQELVDALNLAMRELSNNNIKKPTRRLIPLPVKWSLLTAGIVALVMAAGMAVIINAQFQSLNDQNQEYGKSLAQFVATESAMPVLSEDWISVELFVKEASERQKFAYLAIEDNRGIVRGSTDPNDIGRQFRADIDDGKNTADTNPAMTNKQYGRSFDNQVNIAHFDAPILLQKKNIGRVYLGIPTDSIAHLAKRAEYMLIAFFIIIVSTSATLSYVFSRQFLAAINVVKKALKAVREGHLDERIVHKRTDELGQLYDAMNELTDTLNKRDTPS